jgi:hypothetical protein
MLDALAVLIGEWDLESKKLGGGGRRSRNSKVTDSSVFAPTRNQLRWQDHRYRRLE